MSRLTQLKLHRDKQLVQCTELCKFKFTHPINNESKNVHTLKVCTKIIGLYLPKN